MLQLLRETRNIATLSNEFKKDIDWWKKFLPDFNGISLLWLDDNTEPGAIISTDSCLNGVGGTCEKEYFHYKFDDWTKSITSHITQLEIFTVMLGIKLWATKCSGLAIKVNCDNQGTVAIINSGRTRDSFMLDCLREIAWFTAHNDCMIRAVFISGFKIFLPDNLSRWYISANAHRKFKQATANKGWIRRTVTEKISCFTNVW